MRQRKIVRGAQVSDTMWKHAKAMRQTMTEEEAMVWALLRTNRLAGLHFRRQQVIGGFVVDFYCHQAGLIIELDGEIHKAKAAYDQVRDGLLAGKGFRILRFTNQEIHADVNGVLAKIKEACFEEVNKAQEASASHLTPRPPSLGGKGENH